MRARDPEGAEDVLFRMAASGQAPDIHAYTILLRSCVFKCACVVVCWRDWLLGWCMGCRTGTAG